MYTLKTKKNFYTGWFSKFRVAQRELELLSVWTWWSKNLITFCNSMKLLPWVCCTILVSFDDTVMMLALTLDMWLLRGGQILKTIYNRVQKILEELCNFRKSCNYKQNINGIYNEMLYYNCLQQLPSL